MEHVAECVKAVGSAIGGVATAWAFAIIILNGIKMFCATWLIGEGDLEAETSKDMFKIEPVWFWKNTKDTVNKTKNKW